MGLCLAGLVGFSLATSISTAVLYLVGFSFATATSILALVGILAGIGLTTTTTTVSGARWRIVGLCLAGVFLVSVFLVGQSFATAATSISTAVLCLMGILAGIGLGLVVDRAGAFWTPPVDARSSKMDSGGASQTCVPTITGRADLLIEHQLSWMHPEAQHLRELRAVAETYVDERCAGTLSRQDRRCVVYAALAEGLWSGGEDDPGRLQFLEGDLEQRVRHQIIKVMREVLWGLKPLHRSVLVWDFSLEQLFDPPMMNFVGFPEGFDEYEAAHSDALRNLKMALVERAYKST